MRRCLSKYILAQEIMALFLFLHLCACSRELNTENMMDDERIIMDNIEVINMDNEKNIIVGEKEYLFSLNEDGNLLVTIISEEKRERRTVVIDRNLSGGGSIYADIKDENNGCVLYCSDPAAGLMVKKLYITNDGWNAVLVRKDLTSALNGYPTGILDTETNGYFISTLYHGENVYLYHSDEGESWEPFALEIPGEGFFYIDGESIGRGEGGYEIIINVKKVESTERIKYYSKDGIKWKKK